jgi:HSP20 family protein
MEDAMNQNDRVSQQTSQGRQPQSNGSALQSDKADQSSQTNQSGRGSFSNSPQDMSSQGSQVEASDQRQRAESAITFMPPVDIYEDEAGFTVVADMPGVSKDQLMVRVNGDNLVIEGTVSAPALQNMELLYEEIQTPQYRRSFTLSRELDPGKIEAKLNNGVLRLHIPKAEEAKPRRITVNVA